MQGDKLKKARTRERSRERFKSPLPRAPSLVAQKSSHFDDDDDDERHSRVGPRDSGVTDGSLAQRRAVCTRRTAITAADQGASVALGLRWRKVRPEALLNDYVALSDCPDLQAALSHQGKSTSLVHFDEDQWAAYIRDVSVPLTARHFVVAGGARAWPRLLCTLASKQDWVGVRSRVLLCAPQVSIMCLRGWEERHLADGRTRPRKNSLPIANRSRCHRRPAVPF